MHAEADTPRRSKGHTSKHSWVLLRLSVRELEEFCEGDGEDGVESNEGNHDAHIPASLPEGDVEGTKELRSSRVGAVLAGVCGIRVVDVASCACNVGSGVRATGLARGRRKGVELGVVADDWETLEFVGNERRDGEANGVDVVEERRVEGVGHQRRWSQDSASQGHDDDEERSEQRCKVSVGAERCDHGSDGNRKELRQEGHDPEEACPVGVGLEADQIVEQHEEGRGAHDCVGQFTDQLSDSKDGARERLGRLFSNPSRPGHDPEGLDLSHDDRRNNREHEQGKDSVLEGGDVGAELQEKETGEECKDDVLNETGVLVGRLTPRREQGTLEHDLELEQPWGSVLGSLVNLGSGDGGSLSVDLLNLSQVVLVHRALTVVLGPVLLAHTRLASCSNGVEHEFGRVNSRWALGTSIGKVLDQMLSILTDRAVVDDLSTSLKKEQSVEGLEK